MGRINFEDHALIKRWRASKNMNVTGQMFNDKKIHGNCWKQFAFIVGNYVCFRSFGVHNSKNVENTIEKLQRITREREARRNEHQQRQEEEA
jgi:hypothetical protein